jgi:hypothetical protein
MKRHVLAADGRRQLIIQIASVPIGNPMKAADVDAIVNAVADWGLEREDTRAMALVGSWARGNPHRASDIDLLLISDRADEYRLGREWLAEIDFESAGYRIASSADASYGAVWSRHIALLPTGKVELTFAPRFWARTDIVDAGTRSVVSDAFRIIFDKDAILAGLVAAVSK